MPKRPGKVCTRCGGVVLEGACTRCGYVKRAAWVGGRRGKGYGRDYRRSRQSRLRQNPMCEVCGEQPATETHHIVAFEGLRDAKRIDVRNLQAICHDCHVRITRMERAY